MDGINWQYKISQEHLMEMLLEAYERGVERGQHIYLRESQRKPADPPDTSGFLAMVDKSLEKYAKRESVAPEGEEPYISPQSIERKREIDQFKAGLKRVSKSDAEKLEKEIIKAEKDHS